MSSERKKQFCTITQEDLNAFEEIHEAFSKDFVEPDSNVLELSRPVKGKLIKKEIGTPSLSTTEEPNIDMIVKKHVEEWLSNNVPTIIRQILNSKIDEIQDGK